MYCEISVSGCVALSPPRIAPVCSGDQLELICSTTETFIEWSISRIDETGVAIGNSYGEVSQPMVQLMHRHLQWSTTQLHSLFQESLLKEVLNLHQVY